MQLTLGEIGAVIFCDQPLHDPGVDKTTDDYSNGYTCGLNHLDPIFWKFDLSRSAVHPSRDLEIMTSVNAKCPSCDKGLEKGFLYVRGLGAALFWAKQGDTKLLSRKNLEQINLGQISTTGTGGQAVVEAWLCPRCEFVCFRRVK